MVMSIQIGVRHCRNITPFVIVDYTITAPQLMIINGNLRNNCRSA